MATKPDKPRRTALVLGVNGYIGNAVARAFVRSGCITYGLVRSAQVADALASEEILPVVGSIDDRASHGTIQDQLFAPGLLTRRALDVIVSTTEDHDDYVRHYENIVHLLRRLSQASLSAAGGTANTKPLVIFTSGCKDYGPGPHYATDPALAPHTEQSPLRPPAILALRATHSSRIFDNADVFMPVLVRPTNVHGRSASFYGLFFEVAQRAVAARAKAEAKAQAQTQTVTKPAPLVVPVRPDSICHSLHVDDCGDAYVALAATSWAEPAAVAGQVFNIAARRYETVDDICRALVAEYDGLGEGGVRYDDYAVDASDMVVVDQCLWPPFLVDFPQWTGSDKLRRVTGWTDHRPLFTEALHVYRVAYEAARRAGHENVVKVGGFMAKVEEAQGREA